MAKIEDLLDRVEDDTLRRHLEREVAALKKNKNFGLVFEPHIPETAPLKGIEIEVGSVVQRRDKPNSSQRYRVADIEDGTATIKSLNGANGSAIATRKLQPVKNLGEPVFPYLSPDEKVMRGDKEQPYHTVINGENYHALQLLHFTHRNAVDCIYIDPPYNTGARDWTYNNRYVDSSDRWQHSKWISFMEKRLRLARRLLADDGVLIVTADEHEVHHLGMLLEEVFPTPEYLRHMVTIVHNPKGTDKKNFARVEEHAFFCCPHTEDDLINRMPEGLFSSADSPSEIETSEEDTIDEWYLRRRGQESGYRRQRPNQFYALLVNEETREVVGVGPPLGPDEDYEVERDGDVVTVYPIDTRDDERVWRYSRETMQEYIDKGEIVVTGKSERTGQGWVLYHYKPSTNLKKIKTVWWENRHDAGTHGSDLLSAYLGEAGLFSFPKSVYAVRDCLDAVVRDRPQATILDFFAGSGTTLHATCLLNARDGSQRQCIQVTNNELRYQDARRLTKEGYFPGDPEYEQHGVYERVAKPRTKAVITGTRPDGQPVEGEHVWADRRPYAKGFEENVQFFNLRYQRRSDVELGQQFEELFPTLWMKTGARGELNSMPSTEKYFVSDELSLSILFDEGSLREFQQRIGPDSSVDTAFVVTDSERAFTEITSRLPDDVDTVRLYEDYLRSVITS